jgi:hypothetical protein
VPVRALKSQDVRRESAPLAGWQRVLATLGELPAPQAGSGEPMRAVIAARIC